MRELLKSWNDFRFQQMDTKVHTSTMTKSVSNSSIFQTEGTLSPREQHPGGKEGTYYMDNYEATVTVHKSPPQQRRQFYDYIEIDDETSDYRESVLPNYKISKRKNLRVTFSDHIEVDVFEDFDSVDGREDEEDDEQKGIVQETLYEIPFDRTKGLKQITSSAEFKSVTENISPRPSKQQTNSNAKIPTKTSVTKTQRQVQQNQNTQALLQKRKAPTTRVSLSDLEKKTKEYIAKLEEKNKRAEAHARVARNLFPDISAKVKAQPSYKQFIANARRAVEITRRYERPWVNGGSNAQSFNVWRQRSETVRRSSSLPKNFKIPDDVTSERRRPGSDIVAGGDRHGVRNS